MNRFWLFLITKPCRCGGSATLRVIIANETDYLAYRCRKGGRRAPLAISCDEAEQQWREFA